jgi:membrane associated rhomboid family serine protease
MRYAIIIILTLAYFILGIPSEEEVSALLHHFYHANLLHLGANAFSIWFIYKRWRLRELAEAYLIATASFFIAPVVPVGFSNFIYATIGLRTPPLSSSWWKNPNTIIFLAVTLMMFLLPGISAATHVFSFAAGALYAALKRWINQTINDSSRYTGNL